MSFVFFSRRASWFVFAVLLGSAVAATAATDYRIIPAAPTSELTPANGWPARDDYGKWERSLGGATSNRYSVSTQITPANVAQLQVAWTYRSGDGTGNVQANPVIVGRRLFLPTAGRAIVALDATSGRELWRYRPEPAGNALQDQPARRGLIYWRGDSTTPSRLIFTVGKWIYALDPETGKPVASFGENGRASLPTGGGVTGAIWRDVLVIPGFLGDVFGYDVRTGALRWRFKTIPGSGEFGAETSRGLEQGANCWGGMSLDESRGIAFVTTGSPKPNYLGMGHPGDNLFSNCVIALDVSTGQRLWHFQEIRHDIWDLDLPAPPNLVTVTRDGKKYDAVAQVTKIGNTLLLDRVTGKPLFPFRLRRAPASQLPGEVTADYQPDLELPEPFDRQVFTLDDITRRTPAAHEFVAASLRNANHGWFEPFADARPTVFYGMHGGAEWTGAAVDPETAHLYASSSHLPWAVTIFRDDDPPPLVPATAGEQAYQLYCAGCHGPERKGVGMAPPLRGLRHRLDEAGLAALIDNGRNAMPPMPALPAEEKKAIADFLLAKDRPNPPTVSGPPKYAFGGYRKVLDDEGYPGIKPPWGTLTSIDLNTGRIVWRVPLGEHEELTRAGVPKTGTENFGGAMVTASGLVFCSGTRDRKIRAFSAATGEELWSAELPWHGTAPPATYEVDGRQYVVIAATGGGKLGGMPGDAWVAFALPAP